MNLDTIDWKALERLRSAFLNHTAGAADYWMDERDLASYDQTFAQRIGWKWDHVLAELPRLGWTPPPGGVLDWGCGSGIAGRAFLDHFGTQGISELCLYDRSPLAVQYAARRAREKYPGLEVTLGTGGTSPHGTLLVSHVLNELAPEQAVRLLQIASSFAAMIWIEPGTYEASAALVGVRERLRTQFQIVAPCTHSGACGLLDPANARHWCHHFASPPPEVYTGGPWAKFANLVGIDLSSLPLSYLVLDQRPAPAWPAGATRLLGTPRVSKHEALVFLCRAAGLGDCTVSKRALPEAYRQIKKGRAPVLARCAFEGNAVVGFEALGQEGK
ncbi:MAG: small ribosomal subunit Rsm22 family protein [Verrucomicrobiota bacterium]